jgi:hypothetical protein
MRKNDKNIIFLTVPLSVLTIIASYAGVFSKNTYIKENISYAAQGIGQDVINLFIVVPVIIISALLSYRNSKGGLFVWSGGIFYLLYSYTIYAFALHFNYLFLIYCLIFGLSFYSFVYYIIKLSKIEIKEWFNENVPIKSTSIFFFVISFLFYMIWLKEIIPALVLGTVPLSVIESGLLVNPVHVLDISICLPAILITGIFLLKKNKIGFILTPALLSFCVFMSIAIIAMVVVMNINNIKTDYGLVIIFGFITVISMFFSIKFLRNLK